MPKAKKYLIHVIILILVGTGVYWNSLGNGFVYDDTVTVEENLFIRDWKNLGRFFSRDYYLRSEEYSFRPLVTLTYFCDYSLFRGNPASYHLTSLILHLLSGIALYFLAKKILPRPEGALLAALVFIIHPVQTEAVDGISFREDILCTLFFALSLLMYIKSERAEKRDDECKSPIKDTDRSWIHPALYSLSVIFFILALLAKEMAVTLPLVIAGEELILRRRRVKELFRPRVIGFFFIAGAYLAARFLLLYQRDTLPAAPEFGNALTRFFLVFKGLGLYGRLVFFPVNLTVEYADPLPPVAWSGWLLVPALLTAAFLLTAWLRGKNRAGTFGLTFFVLALLPVLNLVPNSRLGAERFAYLPMLGFSLWAAVALTACLAGAGKRALTRAAVGVLLLALAAGTVSRNRDWKDNLALFTRAVEASPRSSKAHHGLGNEYFRLGRSGAAVEQFLKAIDIFSREPLFYNSLGVAYGEQGQFEEALAQFETSARLNPGDPLVLINLSTLYLRTGQTARALQEIQKYITARPYDPDGYINLGEILLQTGNYRQAIDAYREALARNHDSIPAITGLGYCHYRLGEPDQARLYWERALEQDPGNLDLRRDLGIISRENQ
ncbi:MAG: tetratricopeptide repeat protein [PVC group bacterium]